MTELRKFAYSIIRVVPDPLRDEAVNLGVIVVDPIEPNARAEFLRFNRNVRARLTSLLPGIDASAIEEGIESFKSQIGVEAQLGFVQASDARITSAEQLETLAGELQNQVQLTRPRPYRCESLLKATKELFALFISPRRRPPVRSKTMSLTQLKSRIRRVVMKWGSGSANVQIQTGLEQVGPASHYADFWVESGEPMAALIAIPDDPGEKFEAWARRDSIPTIASQFTRANPRFRAVAVLPPNGSTPTKFAAETVDLFESYENVLVLHADELEAHREEIVGGLF